MTTSMLVNAPELKLKHLTNMVASLTHRLEVARASQNEPLTVLLEQEYEQLLIEHKAALFDSSNAVKSWFQRLWADFADTVPGLYQLHIEETIADNRQQCWSIYYPKTGQRLVTASETEMQTWIKKTYWAA